MRELRVGLVGFGFMGRTHLWVVRNLPFLLAPQGGNGLPGRLPFAAQVAAVTTARAGTAEQACALYGIPRAVSLEELLTDPSLDIVDICAPNRVHYPIARQAILAGKHVLCEKPLAVTAGEADELARLAEDSGLVCGVVFNNRFLLPVLRARRLIDEGRLGRILSFDFSYRHNSCVDPARTVGWKQRAAEGGGTLSDLGPHVIDLCRFLCGEIVAVSGRSQIAFAEHREADGSSFATDCDEAFYLVCETAGGAVGTIVVSKLAHGANDDLTFSVNGTGGSLSFSLMDMNFLNFYDASAEGEPMGGVRGFTRIECVGRYPLPASGFPSAKAPSGWLRGHAGCLSDYLSAVADGRPASASFRDGARAQRVIEAARESDRLRREARL